MEYDFIKIAISELNSPILPETVEVQERYNLFFENHQPKVSSIMNRPSDNSVGVFFEIESRPFYYCVRVDKQTGNVINGYIKSSNQIYLTATSKNLSFEDLKSTLGYENVTGWSFDDFRRDGKTKYGFSRLNFEPVNCRSIHCDHKLKSLLKELSKNFENVQNLIKKSDCYISIWLEHEGNSNKGIFFDNEVINLLSQLKLEVDIDQIVI